MVEMTFQPEMLDTLAKMKGKVFKSYEGLFPVSAPIVSDVAIKFSEEKCAEIWVGEPDEGNPPKMRVARRTTVH